ncbi:hypothetical protein [Giesbergeria anulus]|uniref:Uncharacterized protein n=1 Tax=Giesbergeria anulus TaxID=180197 RepID=A0A1H9NQ66_9BURK|nr:hypothetical protein [Giesbergeria anulus]SER38078.1 hypothetical protein SAMN02982919_02302 [Giesbergeria anulus]
MSAKKAAMALLNNDVELAAFAKSLEAPSWENSKEVIEYLQENVMNTWTLTLVADATGFTEEQIIAALLHTDQLKVGSTCICKGIAKEMFNA